MRIDFQHQAVRDLAWVIGSPCLLSSGRADRVADQWCRIAFLDRIPWLRHLDHHPQELEAWLARYHSRLLGHYFEALIAFWLEQWPRMQLLAWRLPVKDAERVLGEFDFLFHDRYGGRTFHWECAVKFFLRFTRPDGEYEWLGPNPRDTLAGKYRKLFDHQLCLSRQPDAVRLLQQQGISGVTPQALFKGYLFSPAQSDWQRPSVLPSGASPAHLRGWWCHADEPEQIPYIGIDSRWVSLKRLHGLSPVFSQEAEPGLARVELEAMLAQHFAGQERPLLLAELRADGEGNWREVCRGFVVSTHWPGREHYNGSYSPCRVLT